MPVTFSEVVVTALNVFGYASFTLLVLAGLGGLLPSAGRGPFVGHLGANHAVHALASPMEPTASCTNPPRHRPPSKDKDHRKHLF